MQQESNEFNVIDPANPCHASANIFLFEAGPMLSHGGDVLLELVSTATDRKEGAW